MQQQSKTRHIHLQLQLQSVLWCCCWKTGRASASNPLWDVGQGKWAGYSWSTIRVRRVLARMVRMLRIGMTDNQREMAAKMACESCYCMTQLLTERAQWKLQKL